MISGASGGTTSAPGSVAGTLAAASTVSLHVDGSPTPAASATAVPGTWILPLPALGAHSYTVVARWGTWSVSSPAAGSVTVAGAGVATNGSAALVMALYRDVLFRTPSPQEVSGWSALYQRLIGRAPSADEISGCNTGP